MLLEKGPSAPNPPSPPVLRCTIVIERIVRVAKSFDEAREMDREDVAALSFEERISGVERLRREWFGEDRAESRLDRVLVSADRPSRAREAALARAVTAASAAEVVGE
jgi:hypothetical protein